MTTFFNHHFIQSWRGHARQQREHGIRFQIQHIRQRQTTQGSRLLNSPGDLHICDFSAPRSIGRESFTPRSTAISSPDVTSSATVLFRVSVSISFISCLLFSQRRRTAPPAYYLSAKPKRGTNAVRHNVLAVLPVDVVQQVDFPQRAIVNAQLVVGVFDSVSV